ncbi:undecaprenyl-diphosphatase [Caballeronia udeis]|jgi:undecaprenyl-diphosphatase|uniref:Undecaprenyl-diphosphatase n=1 Tax=Caballeronia udeis TaxID=1232866 RepID=A0ABW8MWX4_9BURK
MEAINQSLFLLIGASAQPDRGVVALAILFGEYAIWLVPVTLVFGWLRGSDTLRHWLIEASASALLALLAAQIIGVLWPHPRPFAIGLGHALIVHSADSSFPSDHLTFLWAVAFSFLMHPEARRAGWVLALLGLPMAWARIYLGVHFPFDIAGAASVSVFSAWLSALGGRWFAAPVVRAAMLAYRPLFAPLIRRGWVTR